MHARNYYCFRLIVLALVFVLNLDPIPLEYSCRS